MPHVLHCNALRLLIPVALTPDTFLIPTAFCTKQLSQQTPFAPDPFYTKHLWDQTTFTPGILCNIPLTPNNFCTTYRWHQAPFTPDGKRHLLHPAPPLTPEPFYTKQLLLAATRECRRPKHLQKSLIRCTPATQNDQEYVRHCRLFLVRR